jgi:PTH1 family peptidyl-tRNA hydrolase
MTADVIQLIVGLGNPGSRYAQTRHNAGFFLVDELARNCHVSLRKENKFHGDAAKAAIAGRDVWLLKPDCFMNLSGQSIQALANFYKILPSSILVVHDELDLPSGTARLKRGGGHGGHNGLRDTIEKLASKDFARLRIGIGHPGDKSRVHDYVLSTASQDEQTAIDSAISHALDVIPDIVSGDWDKAMNALHSK